MKQLIDGMVLFLCFIPVLTFHEFAHAWAASKLGDDTARLLGRVTLNPLAHIDLLGTIVLPGLAILLSATNSGLAGFVIGWGKPVPVNPYNLRNRRRDDTLVSLAGPAMNLLLALGMAVLARIATLAGSEVLINTALQIMMVSLFLAFFNLLPIPPLDGSHVVKNLTGMSDHLYANLCQYGLFMVIIAIQIPVVKDVLQLATFQTMFLMTQVVGLDPNALF